MKSRFLSIRWSLFILSALFCMNGQSQFYNGSNVTFGKNRIQHQEFLWQYYRFDRYDTYFYEGGKEIATYVSKSAPAFIKECENRLDYVLQDRMEFIVYTSHTDFKQSNLGMVGNEEEVEVGGTAQIVGTKVFLFFEGDYEKLNRQIKAGVTRMMMKELLYGGDWKDALKNSALLNFPDWYFEGLVSYLSDGWSVGIEDRVRDGVISGRYQKFNRLSKSESIDAGHSLWKYIADVYGESVIPNILYMAKISRNIESGYIFVLGVPLNNLLEEHDAYFKAIYAQQEMGRQESDVFEAYVKTKKDQKYNQYKVSPDGKQAAFVSNILGQYRVWIYDLEEYHREDLVRRKKYEAKKEVFEKKELNKRRANADYNLKFYKVYKPKYHRAKKIFKGEHKLDRLIDESFPVLEWNPRGTELSFITEQKGTVWLNTYTIENGKKFAREIFGLEKVLSFDYSDDGKKMVMSGINSGQSDIYLYHLLGNRQERLTYDNYDDLQPRFIDRSQRVVFVSNRMDDTLRNRYTSQVLPEMTDVFVLDLNDREDLLERITETPEINETRPFQYDSLRYSYLSDRDRMNNRYVAIYDSVISRIDTAIHYRYFTTEERITNDERNSLEYHINAKKRKYGLLKFVDGKFRFYHQELKADQFTKVASENGANSEKIGLESGNIQSSPSVVLFSEEEIKPDEIDIENYEFVNDNQKLEDDGPQVVIIEDFTKLNEAGDIDDKEKIVIEMPKPRNYKLNFTTDKMLAEVGNSFSSQFYQNAGFGAENLTPGFSPSVQVGVSDVFDDRRLIGALRLDPGLDNFTTGIRYDNYLKRLDKSLIFVRQGFRSQDEDTNFPIRIHTHTLRYRLSYPFSEVFSVRADVMSQYERSILLSINDVTLNVPNVHSIDAGSKFELVFDNTLHKGLNLLNGTRAKAWVEYYHNYDTVEETFPSFGVIGLDFRHYQKVHRDIIFAVRFAGNTSFGDRKLVSYLGGVDNWVLPSPKTENLPVDFDGQNYAYQAAISPMRGFYRNARNGTHAVVANSEFRIPLFKYLMNKPIKSDFVENFQIVPFADAGIAWTGPDPYSNENFFNVIEDETIGGPITITLQNQEDPLLVGYGFGLRSRLLGYFVRADWAWGVVDGRTLPREFYLSFNLDF